LDLNPQNIRIEPQVLAAFYISTLHKSVKSISLSTTRFQRRAPGRIKGKSRMEQQGGRDRMADEVAKDDQHEELLELGPRAGESRRRVRGRSFCKRGRARPRLLHTRHISPIYRHVCRLTECVRMLFNPHPAFRERS
jgi:hypothetical protein